MAKAVFHKAQRVYVKPVGSWAHVERVVPKWIRGCDEPIKVHYDCGMGREFAPEELEEESIALQRNGALGDRAAEWCVMRGQNRWRSAEQCSHHPYPGTHPVIVTTDSDTSGWRVPGAEYDRDPSTIEQQAQLIARAPALLMLLRKFAECADEEPESMSEAMTEVAQLTRRVLDQIDD